MKEIPVVFTPDENFMVPTSVAILSMLRSKNSGTNYHFYILVSSRINRSCFKYLEKIKSTEPQFVYTIDYMEAAEKVDDTKLRTVDITTSSLYRLFLARIYDFDRCMYHDGDIIVNRDLSDMYHVEMKDSYVAGIKTIIQHQDTPGNAVMITDWHFKSMDQYIFSGDLVFNLKRIREDHMTDLFEQEMKKSYPQLDQDVLNFCCYDHITFLPLKYCTLNRWLNNRIIYAYKKQIYVGEEIEEALANPTIVHFAGGVVKPWVNLRSSYADVWWRYAKEILSEEEFAGWYDKAYESTIQRDWNYVYKKIKGLHGSRYIFGCGVYGKRLAQSLKMAGVPFVAFIDNDIKKHGLTEAGVRICSLQEVLSDTDASFVIVSPNSYQEITRQLSELGIASDRIFVCPLKKYPYYQALDPKYYEFEYRDLMAPSVGSAVWDMTIDDIKRLDTEEKWKFIWEPTIQI